MFGGMYALGIAVLKLNIPILHNYKTICVTVEIYWVADVGYGRLNLATGMNRGFIEGIGGFYEPTYKYC